MAQRRWRAGRLCRNHSYIPAAVMESAFVACTSLYPVAHSVTPPCAHHNKAGRYNINIYFQNTLVVRRVAIKHKRCLFNFKIIKYIYFLVP